MPKAASSRKPVVKRGTRNAKEKIASSATAVTQLSSKTCLQSNSQSDSQAVNVSEAKQPVSGKPTQKGLDFAEANLDTRKSKTSKRTEQTVAEPIDSPSAKKESNKGGSNAKSGNFGRKSSRGRNEDTDKKVKPAMEICKPSHPVEHSSIAVTAEPTTTGSKRKRKKKETNDQHNVSVEPADGDQQTADKTESPSPPSPKRRKGRKPKSQVPETETKAKVKKRDRKAKRDNSASDVMYDEVFECQHCEFTSPECKKIKLHYASVHTLLYSESKPQGMDDTTSLKKVFRMLGGKVSCRHCNNSIKTPAYYKRHIEWCQSDQTLMKVCSTCNKEIKAFWIHEHELACKRKQVEKEQNELKAKEKKMAVQQATNVSGKRQAASKAMKYIKHINNENEDFDWATLYSTPHMTVPSEDVVHQWQTSLDSGTPLTCTHKGCTRTSNSIDEITEHFWTCSFNGLSCHTWNCRKCSKTFGSEKEALAHVQAKHEHASKKRKLDDDYQSDGVSVSDDEVSSGVPTGDEDEGVLSSGGSEGEKQSKSFKDYRAGSCYPSIISSISRQDLCNSLHIPTLPRLASLLPDEEARKGKPFTHADNRSLEFSIGGDSQVHQLSIGQTTYHSRGCVTYLGAPIRAVIWCPLDRNVQSEILAGDEYIAVLAGAASPTDAAPDAIDIWRVSNLTRSPKTPIDFSLALHLKHNYGRVNQMRWCPDGGFIQSTEAAPIGRLGLLAVAASSGCVHIISIPYLTNKKAISCSIDNQLKLVVPGNEAECTCMDWQKGDDKFVFGGFDDGSVAIWYVGGKHTSLSLTPVKVFPCHTSFVTCITSCPFSSNVFATFSHGWLAWDLRDMRAPYLTPKIVDWCLDLHPKAVWPRMHSTVISCTDPSFGSSALSMLSLGYDPISANQKTPVRGLKITTDVDVCDCSDVLVVGDTRGLVLWHRPILPKHVKGLEKNGAQRTFNKLTAMKSSQVEGGGRKHLNFDYLMRKKEPGGGVKGNVCDMNTLSENKREHSINSVAINPNSQSHNWLLCAGQHGLAHLISLDP